MERLKKAMGFAVFGTLFLSMFFSMMISLAENITPVEVTYTQSEMFIFDQDELEVAKEHKAKILMEKNVIPATTVSSFYEMIEQDMIEPQVHVSMELPKDIFFPPKSV